MNFPKFHTLPIPEFNSVRGPHRGITRGSTATTERARSNLELPCSAVTNQVNPLRKHWTPHTQRELHFPFSPPSRPLNPSPGWLRRGLREQRPPRWPGRRPPPRPAPPEDEPRCPPEDEPRCPPGTSPAGVLGTNTEEPRGARSLCRARSAARKQRLRFSVHTSPGPGAGPW